MQQKQDRLYEYFVSYMNEFHEKNKRRIRASGIVLVLLPVVLGLIRWLTDSDKTVFLIIWVISMFILSVYLVSVDYYDHILYRRIRAMMDDGEDPSGLLESDRVLSKRVMEKIGERIDAGGAGAGAGAAAHASGAAHTARNPEEGGGE